MTEAPESAQMQASAQPRGAPARTRADGLRWMGEGTEVFLGVLARASDGQLDGPTELPGWTGKHLVAHVAANADALRRLAHWARTGEQTPMYSSPGQRAADIEAGARRDAAALREWVASSSAALAADLDGLNEAHWDAEVRTAQGRTVPASEIPWMRTREVTVHAVDLSAVTDGRPIGFAGLPAGVCAALVTDMAGKRGAGPGPALLVAPSDSALRWVIGGEGDPVTVTGTLADLTAYLAGRAGGPVTTPAAGPAPELPPWL
ncbi:MAG: maleylpyruvate isomerase family mycothiol-dependent enzyme [Dermatophilaceae bacterium]